MVDYTDKEKSKLRKLKKNFWRVRKLDKARKLNQKFYTDPSSVYTTFGNILDNQADNDRPKYNATTESTNPTNNQFTDIDEASSFWRGLWEEEGNHDAEAE